MTILRSEYVKLKLSRAAVARLPPGDLTLLLVASARDPVLNVSRSVVRKVRLRG